MKRFMTIFALAMLVMVPTAMAGSFGWSVSNSTATANANTGAIAPDPANPFGGLLYLWLNCSTDPSGMSAAEFDVFDQLLAAGSVSSVGMLNGFLNAGPAPAAGSARAEMLIAVGGCPTGPVLVAQIGMGPDAFVPNVDVCIVNSLANNRNITVDCATGSGNNNDYVGFAKGGTPCASAALCPPVSVEETNWGAIKALYR